MFFRWLMTERVQGSKFVITRTWLESKINSVHDLRYIRVNMTIYIQYICTVWRVREGDLGSQLFPMLPPRNMEPKDKNLLEKESAQSLASSCRVWNLWGQPEPPTEATLAFQHLMESRRTLKSTQLLGGVVFRFLTDGVSTANNYKFVWLVPASSLSQVLTIWRAKVRKGLDGRVRFK